MNTSAGWAYSAARPNGAEYLWWILWMCLYNIPVWSAWCATMKDSQNRWPRKERDDYIPTKWKKSSKKKKKKTWGAMVFKSGKGTWYVFIWSFSAVGWKSQIYRLNKNIWTICLGQKNDATYQRQFNREMGEKHLLRARPLLSSARHLVRLQLPLAEIRHCVYDDPWDATSEINDLGTQRIVSATPCSNKNGRQCGSYSVTPNVQLAHPRKR